jgi:hypothetical protein
MPYGIALAFAQTFGGHHVTTQRSNVPVQAQSIAQRHWQQALTETHHSMVQADCTITTHGTRIEAEGGHWSRWDGREVTHQELVDAEAGVDGNDAAPVVLHPPQRRCPWRVLRQQLRQTLAGQAQGHGAREAEAVTSRANAGGRKRDARTGKALGRGEYLDAHGDFGESKRGEEPPVVRRPPLPPLGFSRRGSQERRGGEGSG